MGFTITIPVSDDRVENLICSGMEGGIGYWAAIADYVDPEDGKHHEYRHLSYPLSEKGAVILEDVEDEGKQYRLDRDAVERGLKLLEKYPKHLSDFINENEDAITGDVFIQLCVLGDIVYG